MLVVSIGCPSGVGPEVSVLAAARLRGVATVLVGDRAALDEAAELRGVSRTRLVAFDGSRPPRGRIAVLSPVPVLRSDLRRPGRPSRSAGRAQLAWIEAALDLTRRTPGAALVTGPVSKAAIAGSGARGASRFTGHTEWLKTRDGARSAVMCFASPALTTSLVTTHLRLARVPRALTPGGVRDATVALAQLLSSLGRRTPRIAVASLNPHAGESELLGDEERRAIIPGIAAARRMLGRRVVLQGPIGAETAYRRALARDFDGVVAMYHDQATIPTKLVAFGDAVNVTVGLSVVRTSVDHGTGYDIAWKGVAEPGGMLAAMRLAVRLLRSA